MKDSIFIVAFNLQPLTSMGQIPTQQGFGLPCHHYHDFGGGIFVPQKRDGLFQDPRPFSLLWWS